MKTLSKKGKMENNNVLPFRPGVGLMILNKENKVFVGKRIDTRKEYWQMPQGGIDHNETAKDAVMREMLEEIGTNNATILAKTKKEYSYLIPEYLIPKLWGGQYKGQNQIWFLIQYLGTNTEISLDHHSHPEFSEWQWVDIEKLPQIVIPFKRDLYISVIEEFRDEILSLRYQL